MYFVAEELFAIVQIRKSISSLHSTVSIEYERSLKIEIKHNYVVIFKHITK